MFAIVSWPVLLVASACTSCCMAHCLCSDDSRADRTQAARALARWRGPSFTASVVWLGLWLLESAPGKTQPAVDYQQ